MTIQDEFTSRKGISRQRLWQLRKLKQGKCQWCGKRKAKGVMCDTCKERRQ